MLKNIILKYCLEIETVIKSVMANHISKVYGVKDYLNTSNWDASINTDIKENLLKKINNEIEKDYNIHTAVTHYIDKYGFVPPFALVKILTFGVASSYYGLLKQSDRQVIAKYFKISDKLLKQILKNLTTIRNVAAHSDRLYNYTSKFYLSFKLIDKNYIKSDNITNLYMVVRCMEKLLTKEQYKELYNSICEETRKLEEKLKSVDIAETAKKLEIGEMTLADIIEEMSKPGRDPRDEMPKQILRADVLKFEDLRDGMVLTGTVRNVTDFGAFVDIGVKHDGLVHISKMSKSYVKHPSEILKVGDIITVYVIGIDKEKGRVNLSLIEE